MNNLNGYIYLLVGFVLVFATKGMDDRAKNQKIEDNNRVRLERLANEKARQERNAIEMAKCRVTVPHDGNKVSNTTKVTLSANGFDSDETDKLTYKWIQTDGIEVKLNPNKTSKDINFDAGAGEYSFEVSVKDNYGETAKETVTVKVMPEPNNSPDVEIICSM